MFFKNKKYFIIIALAAALVCVYISAANRDNTVALDGAIGVIVKPVNTFFGFVTEKTAGFFDYFRSKKELIALNKEAENKLVELEHENSTLKGYEYENERLRQMLDFKNKNPQLKLTTARVVSKDNSNYYKTFLIDKGTKDNVKTDMAVIGSKGLIGYVIEAGKTFARVRTVIDGGSSAGCMVSRTQSLAVAEGDTGLMNSGLMKMMYVSKEMNLIKGDIIETSGMGKIYPPGIVIGRVEEIKSFSGNESHYAIIRPVEDFATIHEVFVVTDFEKVGGEENDE